MVRRQLCRTILLLAGLATVLSPAATVFAKSDTPAGGDYQPPSRWERAKAIRLERWSDRSVLVGPGESVLYYLASEDVYVRVYSELQVTNPQSSPAETGGVSSERPSSGLASLAHPSWSATQICGVDVMAGGGIPMMRGRLRNRVNVTYWYYYATTPARFNWQDMQGTEATCWLCNWQNLSHYTSPALGVEIPSSGTGYAVATGTIRCCLIPYTICNTETYSSRLVVNNSGTYCQ
jgi:hypothetical protein